jgi:hypothetical protein
MSRRSVIILLLIVAIAADTVIRVVSNWKLYANTGIWPLYFGLFVLLVGLLEGYSYWHFEGWYYRIGPKIQSEVWRTAGSVDEILDAIRPYLTDKNVPARESDKGLMFRRPMYCFDTAYLRAFVRVEDGPAGAVIRYQVRAPYAMVLMLLFAISLFFSAYGGVWFIRIVIWYQIGVTAVWAAWSIPRELKALARLRRVRRALAEYGLKVCTRCGHDLFGQGESHLCPKCCTPLFVCFACGYDLYGQTEARCPECATPFEEHLLQQWTPQPERDAGGS